MRSVFMWKGARLAWKRDPQRKKKHWKNFRGELQRMPRCALVVCCCVTHFHTFRGLTTLSYLPVSVSWGLSPAELGPLLRVSRAAAGCQDIVVIWSSDWGRIESKSTGVVRSPLPVPM